MHIFVRTLCLILFVAQHSVTPFMSLFFKYLGLSPLDSGIIRSCQSWLPVVVNWVVSLIKNCNNFFPKRRTIIYLLIFINVGVHTCLIFIPPSVPTDIMHCIEKYTKSDGKSNSKINEISEPINYIAPSGNPSDNNYLVSQTKSLPSKLNQLEDSYTRTVTESKNYGEYRSKINEINYQINHKSENINPSNKNEINSKSKSMPSKLKNLDSNHIQKVTVPLNNNDNSRFYAVSAILVEQSTQKDDLIKTLSPFDETTKHVTSQQMYKKPELSMVKSYSPYDKSEECSSNHVATSDGGQNLNIKIDKFHKNQAWKIFEKIFGCNHAIASKNYGDSSFTTHPNNAVSLTDTHNVPSESTLSAISEKVALKVGEKHKQSADLPVRNMFHKNTNNALSDIDELYGTADNFLPSTRKKVKLKHGELYHQPEGLTTENTFPTSTKIAKLSVQTEGNYDPNNIFFNFFKNQQHNFRPFDILKKPKKMLNLNEVPGTTTQPSVGIYSFDLSNSDIKQDIHHKVERKQKYKFFSKSSTFNYEQQTVIPISAEQETSFGVRMHNIRSRSISRSASENSKASKETFKYIKTYENMSSSVQLQNFEKAVEGAHDVVGHLKDNMYNTTFSNLHVTFTFSLTLEFLYFTSFLLIENMYSLSLLNVLFSHHISFPIWALIVCPILLIGSLLCPCPFQIATHFIVAIAILLIGILLLICVPVDVIERYTTRKRKNSKPTYKADNSYLFHYRLFSSLVVAVIGFLTACNSEFIMWHLEADNTFSSNYEYIYCGYIMTSFLIHFITIRMWKQYKLVGEVEKEDDDSGEWEPQHYDLKDVEQSCCHWPRLVGLASLATQMLLLPFLQPVWLLTLVAGILQGLTESFVLSRKYPYRAGYGTGCFVAGSIVQVYGTRILFLSASAVTLVFIVILVVSNCVVLSATVEIALRTFLPQDGFRVK